MASTIFPLFLDVESGTPVRRFMRHLSNEAQNPELNFGGRNSPTNFKLRKALKELEQLKFHLAEINSHKWKADRAANNVLHALADALSELTRD